MGWLTAEEEYLYDAEDEIVELKASLAAALARVERLERAADKLVANAVEFSKDDGNGALVVVFADDVNALVAALDGQS